MSKKNKKNKTYLDFEDDKQIEINKEKEKEAMKLCQINII